MFVRSLIHGARPTNMSVLIYTQSHQVPHCYTLLGVQQFSSYISAFPEILTSTTVPFILTTASQSLYEPKILSINEGSHSYSLTIAIHNHLYTSTSNCHYSFPQTFTYIDFKLPLTLSDKQHNEHIFIKRLYKHYGKYGSFLQMRVESFYYG